MPYDFHRAIDGTSSVAQDLCRVPFFVDTRGMCLISPPFHEVMPYDQVVSLTETCE